MGRRVANPARALRLVAFCFATIALAAVVIALVPVHHGPETTGWTAYVVPERGVKRIATLGLFDPALWLGAGVAMAVAAATIFLLSTRIPTTVQSATENT